jgi:hypothetical protein
MKSLQKRTLAKKRKRNFYSLIAQSVERRTVNPQVGGSNPPRGAIGGAAVMVWQETVNLPTYVTIGSIPITSTNRIVNSVGRVSALHAGCREFESLTMHHLIEM